MLTRVVAALAVTVGLVVAAVPPEATAGAAAGPCVSKKEFGAVKRGWTPDRVSGTFDTKGKLVSRAQFSEIRRYPRCGGGTAVIVNYERKAAGKPLGLTSKFW